MRRFVRSFKFPNTRSFSSVIRAEKTAIFNCDQITLFQIVHEAPDYPKFVPWCAKAELVGKKKDHSQVELEIGFRYFKDSYISHVYPFPYHQIKTYAENTEIFHHLESVWTFEALSETQARGTQEIAFEFKNPLYQHISGVVLNLLVDNIMKGFQGRADELTKMGITLRPPEFKPTKKVAPRAVIDSKPPKREVVAFRSPFDSVGTLDEDHNIDIVHERNSQTLEFLKGNTTMVWESIEAKISALAESGILKPRELARLTQKKEIAVFRKRVEDIYRLYILQVNNEAMFAMHLKDLCLR